MIGTFSAFAAGGFLAAQFASSALFAARLRRASLPRGVIGKPKIDLIRPVCGLDPFDRETLASSFLQDYPDYEIIFCAPTETDPAVPVVRELIAQYPDVRAQLLIGLDPITGNPKLNNLQKGVAASHAPYLCMADSNLLLPINYLSDLAASWGANTGLVSSPPIGTRPANFGGHLECAFLNSNQARLQFASDSIGNGFAQGKTLFWCRAGLDAAGGMRALGRHLAEDVTATKVTRESGKVVSLTNLPFEQPIGARTIHQVWDRQLRWSRVRRDGFPAIFAIEFMNGGCFAFALLALAVQILGLSPLVWPAYVVLWYLPEVWLMRRAGWPARGPDVFALPLRDVMMLAIWVATFAQRGIAWRGNQMTVPE